MKIFRISTKNITGGKMLNYLKSRFPSGRKVITYLVVAIFVITIFGCGGKEMVKEKTIPEWYLNTPKDPDHLFGVNSATSTRMQLALDKAKAGSRSDIAQQLEVKVQSLIKKFEEEVGSGESTELNTFYNQTMKAIASQTLNGSRVSKQEVFPEGGIYRAYVLMELPLNDFKANVVKKVRNQKKLYERFRASQAFDEMEQDVREYEKFKKEQKNY